MGIATAQSKSKRKKKIKLQKQRQGGDQWNEKDEEERRRRQQRRSVVIREGQEGEGKAKGGGEMGNKDKGYAELVTARTTTDLGRVPSSSPKSKSSKYSGAEFMAWTATPTAEFVAVTTATRADENANGNITTGGASSGSVDGTDGPANINSGDPSGLYLRRQSTQEEEELDELKGLEDGFVGGKGVGEGSIEEKLSDGDHNAERGGGGGNDGGSFIEELDDNQDDEDEPHCYVCCDDTITDVSSWGYSIRIPIQSRFERTGWFAQILFRPTPVSIHCFLNSINQS